MCANSRILRFVFGFVASSLLLRRVGSGGVQSVAGFMRLDSIFAPPSSAAALPRDFMAADRLIKRQGYRFDKYKVITDDGYILELHRIGQSEDGGVKRRGTPVFLMHGFLSVSDMYVLRGRENDLAFQLVDLGYDVWMGNARGSCYSKAHNRLPVSSPAFWDFSVHEIGYYDVPAFVDRILATTGHSRLYYIGHSMGTTVLLIMTSTRPEYNDKIILSVLMAPVASQMDLDDISSPLIRLLLPRNDLLLEAFNSANIRELFPRSKEYITMLKSFCGQNPTQPYCFDLYGLIFGEHRNNLDKKNFGEQVSHFPAGSSVKALYHLSVILKKGFKALDLGTAGNALKYNSTVAPSYRLDKVSSPVAIFYASNDPLSTEKGALNAAKALPNVKLLKRMPESWNHNDYVLGKDMPYEINAQVINLFKKYR